MENKVKKIRITCNWQSIVNDDLLVKLFNSTYITNNNFNKNYIITSEEEFDYLVMLGGTKDNSLYRKINSSKIIKAYMEPSWNPLIKLECASNLFKAKWVLYHEPELLEKHLKENVQKIGIHFKKNPGMLPYSLENLNFHLNNKYQKNKKCSLILSTKLVKDQPQTIYKERLSILSKILKSDLDIDIYGQGLDRFKDKDSRIKGYIPLKLNALKDYKFSIAMENTIEDGYFTEKLTDCILSDTTPIYLGCKDIFNYFDNIHTFDLNVNPVDYIKNILDNNLILDQTENKKLLEYKYNFYIQLINLIEFFNI
jgi:hypothetical protein